MKAKFLVLPLFVLLLACNKDRVIDEEEVEEETKDSFQPMDEFYNENKVEEQEFIITQEDSTGHITGNQGTEIYVSKNLFMYPDRSDSVTFPYKIKLVELYEYDDIIFYQMPTPHSAGVLNIGGEIRVRAFKDAEELVLKPGYFYAAKFSSVAKYTDMKVFQGTVSNEAFSAWNLSTDGSSVSVVDSKYLVSTYKMGWVTPAKNNGASSTTNITFTVDGSGGEFIDLAIVFKDFHGVVLGGDLKLSDVPVGVSATIIGMAKDQDGNYRLHKQDVTTSANMSITLDMQKVTESELLSALDGLKSN